MVHVDEFESFVSILEDEVFLVPCEDGHERGAADFLAVVATANAGEHWRTCDGIAHGTAVAAASHCLWILVSHGWYLVEMIVELTSLIHQDRDNLFIEDEAHIGA